MLYPRHLIPSSLSSRLDRTFMKGPQSQPSSSSCPAQQSVAAYHNADVCTGQGCQVADGVPHIHAALQPCSTKLPVEPSC